MKKLGRTHIAEIDGLRAVAVLSVLLFHSGFTRFAGGGFVGVDVFFVISGYLITGILAAEKSPDIHALGNFYFRRILRIAPALFATLILTILVFFLISPPIKTQSLAPSAIAAVFSYSNFWFYQTVDYFSDSSKNPFLHTWSLAVEEQFYFALPLLIFFLSGKREGSRLPVVISLFVASLLAASVIAFVDPTKAFYFPWLRAWELLAGSLLALVPLTKINARAKAVGADIGLLIILTCVIFYKEKMVFPGLSALPPVVGAMGIIAGAGSPAISNWILRTRLMQWIGKISYSLYLVHWPIACAAALVTNLLLMSTKLGILASSFFFAWLSWRYIERPSRRLAGQVTKRMVFTAFAGACACFVPYTLAMKIAGAAFWDHSPAALNYTSFLNVDPALYRTGSCLLTPNHREYKNFDQDCIPVNGDRPMAIVIGDSHAANIVKALQELHPGVNVLQATAVGCKPVLGTSGPTYCSALMQRMLVDWLPAEGNSVKNVIIAARWIDADIESLKRTVAHLEKMGKRVIIYGPNPEYSMALPLLLAYGELFKFDFSQRMIVKDRFRLDSILKTTFDDSAIYFSPIAEMCSQGQCRTDEGGTPMMSDGDHFTKAGAMRALRGFPLP